MIKIRLTKKGSKANKFYRIVVLNEQRKRSGRAIDFLGYWHPSTDKKTIDTGKLKEWEGKGAVVSAAVKKLAENK